VKCRRELLVAILVYVALDLSLPGMPGAFVFEPAGSVDSIGGGRVAVRVALAPPPAGYPLPLTLRPLADLPRPRTVWETAPLERPGPRRWPRGPGDAPPSSEDPL
jgi:hypothetical protein